MLIKDLKSFTEIEGSMGYQREVNSSTAGLALKNHTAISAMPKAKASRLAMGQLKKPIELKPYTAPSSDTG